MVRRLQLKTIFSNRGHCMSFGPLNFSRRGILAFSAVATALGVSGCSKARAQKHGLDSDETLPKPFKVRFAAFAGQFEPIVGRDFCAQIEFAYKSGFRIWEDNAFLTRSALEQARIAMALEERSMEMGTVVGIHEIGSTALTGRDTGAKQLFLQGVDEASKTLKTVKGKYLTISLGSNCGDLAKHYQAANVVDTMRQAAQITYDRGQVLLIEPMPNQSSRSFAKQVSEAFEICTAVNSPSCKILFDLSHQQIAAGHIIANIKMAKGHIGYFQIGSDLLDGQVGSAELNYENILGEVFNELPDAPIGLSHYSGDLEKNGPLHTSSAAMSGLDACINWNEQLASA